jgi:hypothetical protein
MPEELDEGGSSSLAIRTPAVKGTYTPPNLVEYGSVAKLTQSGGFSGTDAMMMMGCL